MARLPTVIAFPPLGHGGPTGLCERASPLSQSEAARAAVYVSTDTALDKPARGLLARATSGAAASPDGTTATDGGAFRMLGAGCGRAHGPAEWRALTYATVRYEVGDGGVATVAMDQPDTRNALSDELLSDLIAAFEAARDDDAVRCVVLGSTHETTFSSGGNLAG